MRNRTWKTFAVAALLGPAVMLVGCKGDGDADVGDESVQKLPALAEPVSIHDQKTGDSQALKTIGVKLIKTQAEYDALGDANIFADVNFDEHDLVIATLGEQPTGGYSIAISAIQREGDTLMVVGKASAPAADAVVTQALTYPYAAAVISNTGAKQVIQAID